MQHQPSPSLHHPPVVDAPAPAAPGSSRRFFLAGTSALALAATAGGTTAWAHGDPAASAGTDAVDVDLQAGTVVAYIRPGESEVTVMSGDREVVVEDPALVRAIVRTLGAR
ncbi:hypothetical protein [Aquipuribacter hungaricus]|uniref:Uncharacterized protein n=1 Tax=Aquipuribacter hungaricus TaxID=545624 RepID=A0ABV7WHT6_9MICO